VLPAGDGQVLTVEAAATEFYNGATKSVHINVRQPSASILWSNPADIVYGTPLGASQLNATASIPGTFTYTPAAGSILDAGSGQSLRVTFTPSDSSIAPATATVHINVSKARPSITWSTPASITYGTALSAAQLNAVASVAGPAPAGSLTYTPAA